MSGYAWEPTPDYIENANVTRLMRRVGIDDYRTLVQRSQEDTEWFWRTVVDDLGIRFFSPYDEVLDDSKGIKWPRWFTGGSINLAFNCVDRWAEDPQHADRVAVLWEGEQGDVRSFTYGGLRSAVARAANGLRALGVGEGDAVGVFMPMVPEAVVAAYACAHIGAVYLPIFSGFGAPAIAARLEDAKAKVLICADGFWRRGSKVAMKDVADTAVKDVPSLEAVVVLRHLDDEVALNERDVTWEDAFAGQDDSSDPVHLDPEHPLMIAYTSGTTGKPKGAVHVHGGFLVKIAEEAAYQTDVKAGDVLYWVTDMGWIMGPWAMVGSHANGACMFLYEGAPNHPTPDRLWDMCSRHGVTILGISPTLVRALMPAGDEMVRKHDLSKLRIMGSTGEPWNPDPYRWLSEVVGEGRCPIINISGGTEIGACFLGQAPVIPTKNSSLGTPALGMAIDVYDSDGHPAPAGQVGELVCTKPWPAQTRGFWNAPERYLDAYWSRWDDVWVHGDWASVDEDGYWFLHGRSDDTMNIAGKRIGPAEFESAAVGHPDVVECAAVGVPDEVKGTQVWCFCIPAPGVENTAELEAAVAKTITDELGKAFKPAAIRFVPELPKTRSAKILRRAIKALVTGDDPGDMSSLENPSALDAVRAAAGR